MALCLSARRPSRSHLLPLSALSQWSTVEPTPNGVAPSALAWQNEPEPHCWTQLNRFTACTENASCASPLLHPSYEESGFPSKAPSRRCHLGPARAFASCERTALSLTGLCDVLETSECLPEEAIIVADTSLMAQSSSLLE